MRMLNKIAQITLSKVGKAFVLYQWVWIMIGTVSTMEMGCSCKHKVVSLAKPPIPILSKVVSPAKPLISSLSNVSLAKPPIPILSKVVSPAKPIPILSNVVSPAKRTDITVLENGENCPCASLPNIGNTCYMNSVLQIIAALYADKVQRAPIIGDMIKRINNNTTCCQEEELIRFKEEMVKQYPMMGKLLTSANQEDPVEFLEEIQHYVPILDQYKVSYDLLDKRQNDAYTLIYHDIASSNSKEINTNVLMLPSSSTDNSININHLLSSYSIVSNDTRNHTGNDYSLYRRYTCLPTMLCISVNRADDSGSKKLFKLEETDKIKIIADLTHPSTAACSFHLEGFIVHHGTSLRSGHYYAYVKRAGKWYLIDDALIRTKSDSDIQDAARNATLLFYKKS